MLVKTYATQDMTLAMTNTTLETIPTATDASFDRSTTQPDPCQACD